MRKIQLFFLCLLGAGILTSSLLYTVIPETNCPCGHSIKADFFHPLGIDVSPSEGMQSFILMCAQDVPCYPSEPNHFFYLSADITALVAFFYIQYVIEISIRKHLKKKK